MPNQDGAHAPTKPDVRTQILQQFMQGGRLLAWPRKFKRQYFLIEEIAKQFEPERRYAEQEVNAILKAIYPYDHCTLRRYLVDLRFLQRKNGEYWR